MKHSVKFLIIGYIERRKGQDILVDAIFQLPKDIMNKSAFTFVGQSTSLMAQDLIEKSKCLSNVSIVGAVTRETIHELLDSSDCLICPSREDPMPTVCAEAMMHSVPCLVSDATGIAAYIKDGLNGMLFQSENVSELREKIVWCVENHDRLKEMGKNAYIIYEEHFSMEIFEHKLLKYIGEMLK